MSIAVLIILTLFGWGFWAKGIMPLWTAIVITQISAFVTIMFIIKAMTEEDEDSNSDENDRFIQR